MSNDVIAEENRKPKRPKRLKKLEKGKKKNIIIGSVVVILLGSGSIIWFNNKYIYNDSISKNIFIEETDVSNMTEKEALKLITEKYKPDNILLKYEAEEYEISPEDIELKYELKNAVTSAYGYTKTDSYFNNVKRVFSLNNQKYELDIKATYNETKLSDAVNDISNTINKEMSNAKVKISSGGGISVTPSVIGTEVDIVANKEIIYNKIKNKDYSKIDLKVNTEKPSITTDDANSVNALLAQHSTKFSTSSSLAGRIHNIQKSASSTSDILLMPGEEFSYNTSTGKRTKSNGYKDAPVIVNGKLEEGSGGGVCQVSTTLYNAVLYSGLDITSVRNHSLISSYAPIGKDAMVSDGWSDLRFKNPYDHPIYIKNVVYNGVVTSKIYGNASDKKNVNIKVNKFTQNGKQAAKTYREYKDSNGNVIETEYITTSVYKD